MEYEQFLILLEQLQAKLNEYFKQMTIYAKGFWTGQEDKEKDRIRGILQLTTKDIPKYE